jgi:hypothetical protein
MDDRESKRLLEVRLDRISEALLDTQDQLIEQRSRNSALKLVLFTVLNALILDNRLELGDVLKGLADAERQADPTDPVRAVLAHEVQETRSELGRLLAPAQVSLSHGVLATLQRGFQKSVI